MALSTFTWIPSKSLTRTSKPRVTTGQFGDGYSQRTRFGINTLADSWSLSFVNNSNTIADLILAFLEDKGGSAAFYFTPPYTATQYKVVCPEWSTEYTSHISKTIQCTFVRVYDVDVA
jgi:phage-related protein